MSLGHKTNCFKTWHRRQFFLSSKINVSFYPNQSIAVLTILVFGSFTFIKSQCRILYDFDALLFLLRYNLNDKSVTGHVWFIFLFWTLNWCEKNQVTFSQTNSVINADLCFKFFDCINWEKWLKSNTFQVCVLIENSIKEITQM